MDKVEHLNQKTNLLGLVSSATRVSQAIFLSQLYSGRISDREIVERSGIVHLPYDDSNGVMADKGFMIGNRSFSLSLSWNSECYTLKCLNFMLGHKLDPGWPPFMNSVYCIKKVKPYYMHTVFTVYEATFQDLKISLKNRLGIQAPIKLSRDKVRLLTVNYCQKVVMYALCVCFQVFPSS